MDSSSMDNEGSSLSESLTTTNNPSPVMNRISPPPVAGKGGLCRMGSGTSVIIDTENGIEAESRKLPSSKYKGVVPQPNGRWGAQIYEKHQRVWLGTFNEEDEAARAYDVAAQRFRGRDAVTNFKPLSPEEENGATQLRFLNSRSKAEVVDMLRKHTYYDELQQNKRNLKQQLLDTNCPGSTSSDIKNNVGGCRGMTSREQLFEKVVTPSDVGKLNRLVIPKQHAEKHFPLKGSGSSGGEKCCSSSSKGVLLNFEDVNEKVWRFRYSYWNSSQSYVLTKGWSRFVKEKCLKAGDVVSFQRSTGPDRQLFIDWKPSTAPAGAGDEIVECPIVLRPTAQMLRLFGVDICNVPANVNANGKRLREVELLAAESNTKKQMIVAAL